MTLQELLKDEPSNFLVENKDRIVFIKIGDTYYPAQSFYKDDHEIFSEPALIISAGIIKVKVD